MGEDVRRDVQPLIDGQKVYIERIAKEKPASFRRKILNMVHMNSSSVLTGYNNLEILQDASMKYPRLLEDIKAAQSSVHLNYYIWTEDDFTMQIKEALIERAKAGVEVRCLYEAGYFHPKTLNVDNAVISIGTANMDYPQLQPEL